jgi:two-component system cell cycle sensor histidine kinase/response regulator CckA
MLTVVETKIAAKNILVVEDEGLIAMDLQLRLEGFGYVVPGIAKTADQAVQLNALHLPDLILMDIHLKGERDGIQAAEEIRRKYDVPIVFVTAHTDPATIVRANMTEPVGYVVKPYGGTDLRVQIEVAHHKYLAERKHRKNEALFSSTLRNIGDAVIATGAGDAIVYMNSAAELLTGWTQADAFGEHFAKVLALEQQGAPITDNLIRMAALNEKPLSLGPELILVSRDGRRYEIEAELSAALAGGSSAPAVFTFKDITQRNWEADQHCRKQAIRSVERLTETTTHAQNNLLTSILGHGELLVHAANLSPEQLDVFSEIYTGALELTKVVRQMSAIPPAGFPNLREININDVIRQALDSLSNSVPDTIVLKAELDPEIRPIHADWDQLEQILFALIGNAREAIKGAGEIVISTQNSVFDSSVRLCDAQNMVIVKVRDTGEGMNKETSERILEPFFTTRKGADAHPGLGLYITQATIATHRGFLDVKSELGIGTVVTFGIPALETDPLAYLGEGAGTESALKTVLVVEDDNSLRHLLRKVLEKQGYAVVEARDMEEALMVADLHAGSIHVLLTDAGLPSRSYAELLRQFAGMHPEAGFLLLSGGAGDVACTELPAGAEFLPMPFCQKDLLGLVQELLSRPDSKEAGREPEMAKRVGL